MLCTRLPKTTFFSAVHPSKADESITVIHNCTNLGTIVYNNGSTAGTGGVLGYANGTITVTGCKNYGTTSTTSANNNTTYNVYFSNDTARDGWGGIVGYSNSMLTLSGCENRASLIWKQNDAGHNNFYAIGGIVGKMNNGLISSSKNFGNIYGGKLTGGIVGEVIGGATVSQCYNAGPVQTWGSGTYSYYSGEGTYVGGIAGASRGTIEYCYSIGTVTDSSGKGFAAGIAAAMLPGLNGFEVIERIRNSGTPVIFLTAMGDVTDKIKGLRMGAEDYIVKPFEAMELLARIEVVLRRFKKDSDILYFKDITVDVDKHTVMQSGVAVDLTPKEFDVLVFFLRNQNLAISRDRLLASVWGYEFEGESRTVDIHIQQIRKKLNLKKNLVTIPKLGYRLDSEVSG